MNATTNTAADTAAIVTGLEERAKARAVAADRLLLIANDERNGLVREEMMKGVTRLLNQEVEYLEAANRIKKVA